MRRRKAKPSRLSLMGKSPSNIGLVILLAGSIVGGKAVFGDEPQARSEPIDATTLRHKVMCGYQGWFRCPDDGTDDGWLHWSRRRDKVAAETLTVEMWPDLTEYTAEEKYPVHGFSHPDKSQAYLFSSANRQTVQRHFHWMEEYGI